MGINTELFIYASAGGILPALLWLWFWLKEDRTHPEPRRVLALAFLGGMVAILPTIALQLSFETIELPRWISSMSQNLKLFLFLGSPIYGITIHAAIEELVKFGFCFLTALRSRANDEPIDPIIYMITTALGFAAVENTLFIISTYLDSPFGQEIISSVIVGNIRFIGASLLHVASSAAIGIALALAFRKSLFARFWAATIGIAVATTLHTYFNFLIIKSGVEFVFAFPLAWVAIVVIILFFERIKRIKYAVRAGNIDKLQKILNK